MELFEIFGEFDSYMEINEAAEGLKMEGDLENLRKLAKENGLELDVEDYINGEMDELCDPISAAIGKLAIENKEENNYMYSNVIDYLSSNCDEIELALAIRKKGKRVKEAAVKVMEEAKKHMISMPGGKCGYCGEAKGFQIIKNYYLEG